MRRIFVIGTSGLAREMAQLIGQVNRLRPTWSFAGYISDHEADIGRELAFGKVAGDDAWLASQSEPFDAVLGIGHPAARRSVVERLARCRAAAFPNLVHPSVEIDAESVKLGKGNVVTRGCVFTCGIEVGDFNHFNWNATIGHDVRIGSFNVINPSSNISGNVAMGDAILVGVGAQVLENLSIASDTTIGAGAVVTSSIDSGGGVYVGVPARRHG